ncbi:hypothetical protein N665_0104s0005 [Sinapis alba]|nr:hypothetical protein N665_0104s0005 [Sinapis alba]
MDYSDDDSMLDTESGEDNSYSDDAVDGDHGFAEDNMDKDSASQLSYVVLKEEDIHKHQRTVIEQVSTVLSISQVEAIVLLLHYQWCASKVEDEWFTDEDKVRKTVGLLKEPIVDLNHREVMNIICGICFESYPPKDIATVSCGHTYCMACWTGYITEDAHGPLDCDTVAKWIFKNNDESENTTWILANTKPCPNCKRQIEKNQGCDHMTCSEPCNFEFCWMCLRAYPCPGDCNKFKGGDEAENKREMAKTSLDRYMHYYERWVSNQSSRLMAMRDLETLQTVQLKQLSVKQNTPETQLQFIVDAWLQIIECRRVLKWTFAYGYYLPQYEHAKKQFFEYLQGEAQVGLERLHHCAEVEFKQFVSKTEDPSKDFDDNRMKLTCLTRVTKTYFKNLVKALENGLADVEQMRAK